MCRAAPVGDGLRTMITVECTHQDLRRLHRRRRRHLHRRAGPGDRLPRARTAPASRPPCGCMVGLTPPTSGRPRSPAAGSPTCPTPGREVGVLLDASAQHAGRTGREILTIAQRTMGLPARRVDEMLDLVSLTGDGGRPPGAQLLPRHAAAARHRHRPDRRPGGADPRRARQRARPRRHPLDARPAPRLRRPRRDGAALLPPAPRDRGHRRRHRRDRQRPDRRPGHQGRAAPGRRAPSSRAANVVRLADALHAAGVATTAPYGDGALRTDADARARRAGALTPPGSPSPSCAPPTAPDSRRCSSSSPQTPSEKAPSREGAVGMTAIAVRDPTGRTRTAASARIPLTPGRRGRAAQDVRHPVRASG